MTLFLNRSALLETILSQVGAKMLPVTPTSVTDATCRPDWPAFNLAPAHMLASPCVCASQAQLGQTMVGVGALQVTQTRISASLLLLKI